MSEAGALAQEAQAATWQSRLDKIAVYHAANCAEGEMCLTTAADIAEIQEHIRRRHLIAAHMRTQAAAETAFDRVKTQGDGL